MRTLLPVPLFVTLLLQTGLSTAITNDFSSYPEGSQPCMYQSADQANCKDGASGAELNNCLCKNTNNFVYNTARCVAEQSPSDIVAVYETLSANCAGTGVILAVSEGAFLAAASAATQSAPTPTPTPTDSSSSSSPTNTSADPNSSITDTPTDPGTTNIDSSAPSPTPSDLPPTDSTDGGNLSTSTKIGIGVGVGFGLVAALLAAWFIWAYQRRRRPGHQLHENETGGNHTSSSNSAFGLGSAPHTEYAQDNIQQEAAEMDPASWKPQSGFVLAGFDGDGNHSHDKKAGVPLLAEMGTDFHGHQKPVELPASVDYGNGGGYPGGMHGAMRSPTEQRTVSPSEGLSSGVFSQPSDVSPIASQPSDIGGYYRG